MEYRKLGTDGPEVSLVGLGTMTWGEQNKPEQAFAQLQLALDHGVNLIDTAEMYPVPPRAETYGRTEEILGQWLARNGQRDKLVIASKVAGPASWLSYIRDGRPRLNRKHIEQALDASLRRLGTDYLDLYQLHWPDRNTNYFGELGYQARDSEQQTPLEETLQVLSDLVKAGKVRQIGLSNETPWGTMRSLQLAETHGWPRMASIQNPYNLLNRSFEVGLAEVAHREQCGLLAYSPLAFGVLSGKYRSKPWPEGARLTLFSRFSRYTNDRACAATRRYCELAGQYGLEPAQMALAWVNSRPFLTSNLVGATTMEQLKTNLDSIDIKLSDDVVEAIEAIHRDIPNPAP